jgi:diguanylate cyclase (GGDEF)-like protein
MLDTVRCRGLLDADFTIALPVADEERITEVPPERETSSDTEAALEHGEPVGRPPAPAVGDARAALMVLTGAQAGRSMTLEATRMTIGRALDADLVVDDAGVSRHHARIVHGTVGGFFVEDLASTNGTFVGAVRIGISLLRSGDLLNLGPRIQVRFADLRSLEGSVYRELYESSVEDHLTHVFNRRYLSRRLLAEVVHARRSECHVAVLVIDVDSMRAVNDSFGHPAGDRALCSVAAEILRVLRVEDVLARYGGDEFVVLSTGTDRRDAGQLAERIRLAVEGLRLRASGREVRVTASIGIASLSELAVGDDPVAVLLSVADSRMCRAKAAGKNQVWEIH